MIGSAESAIELTQITRVILVELRTLTSTLKKMGKRIAAIKEKKVFKALKSTLEAAQQDLEGEAAALKKRLASNPEAIRILVEARASATEHRWTRSRRRRYWRSLSRRAT